MSKAAARQPCFLLGANRPRRNRPDATLVCRPSRARRFSHAARRPAEVLKLLTFSFFAKHFKLCRQLAERKREGREGTTFP